MGDWQPQNEQLGPLVQYLHASLSARDNNERKHAEEMLQQGKASPDFNNYLCYLLWDKTAPQRLQTTAEKIHIARSNAGILLKNNIRNDYKTIPEPSKAYIRSHIFQCLQDPNAQIRKHCGGVVSEIIRKGQLQEWGGMLAQIVSLCRNETGQVPEDVQDGAMKALLTICEDNKKALTTTYGDQCPADFLVPSLLEICRNPTAKVRADAVAALIIFLEARAEAVVGNLDKFLEGLFELATDSSQEVKKGFCRAVLRAAEYSPAKIVPHLQPLIRYLLQQQMNEDDPELALQAAEFWLTAGEDKDLQGHLAPYLQEIIPVLLQCMVYSADDVIRLDDEAQKDDAEADMEDRAQDLKPSFAREKPGAQADDDSDEEGEIDEGDDLFGHSGDPEMTWNLRKCSAAALDVLATVFKHPVFEITLPSLRTNLAAKDWPDREAAVLTIGAISEGCMEAVAPHLPELMPYLITLLDDGAPVVRKITCWSIARYSGWAASLGEAGKEQIFLPIMDGLLKHMLDNNKRVQEAAASAFLTFEENTQAEMGRPEYLQVIVQQYINCFAKYKERNMPILHECIAQLAVVVGTYRHVLPNPNIIEGLMPSLVQRLAKVPDGSTELFPLLEALNAVASALGPSFTPYATQLYTRCMSLVVRHMTLTEAYLEEPEGIDPPDSDFMMTALDLVSGMVQALEPAETRKMMASTTPHLFDILPACLGDTEATAQQSAFALLGDSAVHIFDELRPRLSILLPTIISSLDLANVTKEASKSGYPVQNNACWSCGEIAMRASSSELEPFADALLQGMFQALTVFDQETVKENAGVALGRICGTCPSRVAPHLAHVSTPLLQVFQPVQTEEKASALAGFSKAVLENPQALGENFVPYLMVAATATQADKVVQQVIDVFKQHPNYSAFLNNLNEGYKQALTRLYRV